MFTHLSRIAFFVFLFTAHLCSAQNRFFGTVIEAPDGHSFVLESSVGKVNGVLQYVEVPEPDQALRQIVIDHFRSLTIGKRAEFQVLSMNQSSLAGRLIVNGVDIGNQLLRDGAAWLLPAEQTGQSQGEYISYKESEDQARSERRGVWSIPNLKPAWLVRAENEERLRLELASKPKPKAKLDIVSQFQTISLPGRAAPLNTQFLAFDKNLWLDVFAGTGIETPGLKTYSDPDRRTTLSTHQLLS